jgi:hypothetical protein
VTDRFDRPEFRISGLVGRGVLLLVARLGRVVVSAGADHVGALAQLSVVLLHLQVFHHLSENSEN